jgi:hypothetical protein
MIVRAGIMALDAMGVSLLSKGVAAWVAAGVFSAGVFCCTW